MEEAAAGVQGEAEVAGEEGEEEREVEGAGEVEDRGDGQAFLFFREAFLHVSGPDHRVWLGLPRDEQLAGQLVWLRLLLVCEQLLPVWPPVSLLAAAVLLCLSLPAVSSLLAISC